MALSRQTKKPTRHRATEPLPGEERLMELPTHELPERGYGGMAWRRRSTRSCCSTAARG